VDNHEHKIGYHIHTKDILELGSVSASLNYKKFIPLNLDTKVKKNMGQIFISYAWDDDEPFVKQLYQDLTENGIDVWWDRKAIQSRGLTFQQELREAIEGFDRGHQSECREIRVHPGRIEACSPLQQGHGPDFA